MEDLQINRRLTIPASELDVTSSRSGGPGGQNVNKVNSKVTLKWSPRRCEAMPADWRRRFMARYSNRINREGQLILQSQRFRDRASNLADVRGRLTEMLLDCQSPPKTRKPTRPTRGSQRRRLDQKKKLSEKKRARRKPRLDD